MNSLLHDVQLLIFPSLAGYSAILDMVASVGWRIGLDVGMQSDTPGLDKSWCGSQILDLEG